MRNYVFLCIVGLCCLIINVSRAAVTLDSSSVIMSCEEGSDTLNPFQSECTEEIVSIFSISYDTITRVQVIPINEETTGLGADVFEEDPLLTITFEFQRPGNEYPLFPRLDPIVPFSTHEVIPFAGPPPFHNASIH